MRLCQDVILLYDILYIVCLVRSPLFMAESCFRLRASVPDCIGYSARISESRAVL